MKICELFLEVVMQWTIKGTCCLMSANGSYVFISALCEESSITNFRKCTKCFPMVKWLIGISKSNNNTYFHLKWISSKDSQNKWYPLNRKFLGTFNPRDISTAPTGKIRWWKIFVLNSQKKHWYAYAALFWAKFHELLLCISLWKFDGSVFDKEFWQLQYWYSDFF